MRNSIELYGDFFTKDADDFQLLVNFLNRKEEHKSAKLINFEGVITDRDLEYKGRSIGLRAYFDAKQLHSFSDAYFTLNNNHVLDFGTAQFINTQLALGDHWVGSNKSVTICGTEFVLVADEFENCEPDKIDSHHFNYSLLKAPIKNKVLVVHGGLEYSRHPSPYQRYLCLELAKKKPTAIVFIHSHVAGYKEISNGVPIYYGLGNFVFSHIGGKHGLSTCSGLALQFTESQIAEFAITIEHGRIIKEPTTVETRVYPIDFHAYKKFFRGVRPIDASLRPRGMYRSYVINKMQRSFYLILVTPLIQLRVQNLLKRLIQLLVR